MKLGRLWKIWTVSNKYGLREFLDRKPRGARPRGERLRLALEELGPVFIKFGQALSTRPDILPPDIALELSRLQDNVPPFSGAEAKRIIELSLGKKTEELFAEFDETPLASASVAQVHAARLKPSAPNDPGMEVVAKVIRPGIRPVIESDVALLRTLAELVERWHPEGKRLRPCDIVREYETVIFDELDLMREGANCAQLRRNWLGSELIYHPLVFWDLSRPEVLVMERIHGIPISKLDELRKLGVDFKVLAERGVEIFFKQVFRDNFFHADMHPGNIFVNATQPKQPSYLAVDFGIVGALTAGDQRYLAENFFAFFNRDYRRIAELHVESEWIPADTRIEEFESAIRTVSEPIFQKPLKEISFGFFLLRLFQIARRFRYQVQPQLALLQKTLFQVEGLGRQLYDDLDLWTTAKPIMEQWMLDQVSPAATLQRMRKEIPHLSQSLPLLAQQLLKRLQRGEDLSGGEATRLAIEHLREESHRNQARLIHAVLSAGFLITAGLLWHLLPPLSWALGLLGLWCAWRASRSV
ncbi:MAG: ubiquinone biosynthesis regulatory protein kinase UbiB [Pseudomonadota bacterium]